MANCIRCGAMLDEFDAGGDMICQNCESRGAGHGSGTDVPCQRCGMYLPPHELRMWNSRLYCAYCIMDIQDEERYGKGGRQPGAQSQEPIGGGISGFFGLGGSRSKLACERCGRMVDTLYDSLGVRLCSSCYYSDGAPGAGGAKPSRFSQLVFFIKEKIGLVKKPARLIVNQQPSRAKLQATPVKVEGKGEVFDMRGRRMAEKKPPLEEKRPLSESTHKEKKPAPKSAREAFSQFKKSSDSK